VNWGTENREAPIRLANATSPSSRNLEIRCVDATANPYIALASTSGMGFNGIMKNHNSQLRNSFQLLSLLITCESFVAIPYDSSICVMPCYLTIRGPIVGDAEHIANGLIIATGHTCWVLLFLVYIIPLMCVNS
jgi:hypothetical protein